MRKTYILIITIIGLVGLSLYTTYAMFTADLNIGEFVNLTASTLPTDSNIVEYERITLEAGKSKTIDLNITNSTSNSLYYGVWYEMIEPETINEDIKIGKLTGSSNATIGELTTNETKTVKLAIVNNSNDDIIINVGVGYSNTNSLNLPTNRSVITGEVTPEYIASDRIIQLAGNCTSWSSGFEGICATSAYEDNGVTKYHEYRYVGAEPNNYVKFNDDMYRIIGVFDDNSHGVEGEWLVKLIAANPLGGYSWGTTNIAPEYTTYSTYNNNWETASANILLNEYFLNATDTSATYKSCSDWTYYFTNNYDNFKTKNCGYIIGYGIQTTNLRNYIQPVTWYLKGYDSGQYSKQNFYACERSDATTIENCTSGNSGAYASKVANKSIGLMYVSDYMYASGYYASTSTASASSLYYGQQNWLYKGFEWTITTGEDNAFYVDNGYVSNSDGTDYPYVLRPTFYLKTTIKIKSGNGTFINPFVIG